jgi:hypothetical protein
MACLLPINPGSRLVILIFALVLVGIGAAMLWRLKRNSHSNSP